MTTSELNMIVSHCYIELHCDSQPYSDIHNMHSICQINHNVTFRIINSFSYSVDLLHPMLVVASLPLQFLAVLPRLFQLSLVQVAAATGSRQVLLQLSDGNPHLLKLGMVFLHKDHRNPQIREEMRGGEWRG